MKHLIIALVIILIVAFLVLPLVLISLNKLRSPFDSFALKNNSGLVSQNYIPLSADLTPSEDLNPQKNTFNLDLEKTCNASGRTLTYKEVTKLFDKKAKRATVSSNDFGFIWSLNGEYEEYGTTKDRGTSAILFAGGKTDTEKLGVGIWAGKYKTKECADYYNKTFAAYQDTGRFFEEYKWEENGYLLQEKGLSTVNGHNYYWYAFENSKLRGAKLPEPETGGSLLTDKMYADQSYTIVFDMFSGSVHYRITFQGTKKMNKSYRNIIKTSNNVLTGLSLSR